MPINSEIIKIQFEVSESQFGQTQTESYRPVGLENRILVGHEQGFDHVAFICHEKLTSWYSKTSQLDARIKSISGLGQVWESGAYVLRYPSNFREQMQDYVYELINSVNLEALVQSSDKIIEKYVKIWRNTSVLGLSEQMGLFGELWILEKLMLANNPEIVHRWTGPEGATHDFELETCHLEIKTTSINNSNLKISSLNQLRPSNPDLYLVVVNLDQGNGRTLSQQIEIIHELMGQDVEMQTEFLRKLEIARYNEAHSPRYISEYEVIEPKFILIDSNTDVLHEDRFDSPIRSLSDLKWTLDTTTMPLELLTDDFWLFNN